MAACLLCGVQAIGLAGSSPSATLVLRASNGNSFCRGLLRRFRLPLVEKTFRLWLPLQDHRFLDTQLESKRPSSSVRLPFLKHQEGPFNVGHSVVPKGNSVVPESHRDIRGHQDIRKHQDIRGHQYIRKHQDIREH